MSIDGVFIGYGKVFRLIFPQASLGDVNLNKFYIKIILDYLSDNCF